MPKSRARKASAPSNARKHPRLVTNLADPPGLQVGLPQVPALYGLKPRKQYLPWTHVRERLASAHNYWICTTRPDGRPHSIPVWGFFFDDTLYFGTGRSTRKARNLVHNPALSIHLESGDDVVILEGTAEEVAELRQADLGQTRFRLQRKIQNAANDHSQRDRSVRRPSARSPCLDGAGLPQRRHTLATQHRGSVRRGWPPILTRTRPNAVS